MKTIWLWTLPVLLSCFAFIDYATTPFYKAQVGELKAGSAAEQLGFQDGDRIESVGGQKIGSWNELELVLANAPHQTLDVQVSRNGQPVDLRIQLAGRRLKFFGAEKSVGYLAGLDPRREAPILALKTRSPLLRYGLQTGDEVIELENQTVQSLSHFLQLIHQHPAEAPMNLKVRTLDRDMSLGLSPLGEPYTMSSMGLESPLFTIRKVHSGPGRDLGLKSGDRILLVQGRPATEKLSVTDFIEACRRDGRLTVSVIRGEAVTQLELKQPNLSESTKAGFQGFLQWLDVESFQKIRYPPPSSNGSLGLWWRSWLELKMWSPAVEEGNEK